MKDFIILLKALYGSSAGMRLNKNKKGKVKYSFFNSMLFSQLLSGFIIALVYGAEFYPSSYMACKYLSFGSEEAMKLLTMQFTGCFIALFGCTSIFVFSVFFMSKSDDALTAYPIKPSRLFFARFVISYISSFSFSAVFFVQGMIFVSMFHPSFLGYFSVVFIFLLLPIVMVSLSFSLLNLVGKFVKFKAHKSSFTVSSIVFGGISMAGFLLMSLLTADSTDTSLTAEKWIDSINGYYNNLSFVSWLGYLQAKAVIQYDAMDTLNLLYCLAIAAVSILLAIFIGNQLYFQNLASQGEKKKKALPRAELDRKLDKTFLKYGKTANEAIYRRELAQTIGNGSTLLYSLIVPLSMGISMISTLFAFRYADSTGEMSSLFNSPGMAYALISLGLISISLFPFTSYASLSYEGRAMSFIKTAPLDLKPFLGAKTIYGIGQSVILSLIYSMIYVFGLRVDYWLLPLVFFGSLPIIFVMNEFALLVGIKFAIFDWDSPIEITQRGWGPVIMTIGQFVIAGLAIGLNFICASFMPSSFSWFIPLIVGVPFIALYFFLRYLCHKTFLNKISGDLIC
jgi:ABC-2 type transport system permease protein